MHTLPVKLQKHGLYNMTVSSLFSIDYNLQVHTKRRTTKFMYYRQPLLADCTFVCAYQESLEGLALSLGPFHGYRLSKCTHTHPSFAYAKYLAKQHVQQGPLFSVST